MSLESEELVSYDNEDNSHYLRVTFKLGTRQVIHKRKIYGLMDFLADSGGVYGSLFLLGSVLHFIVTQDILNIKLLQGHFKVTSGKLNQNVFDVQQDGNL